MPNSLFGRLIFASVLLLTFFFSFIAYMTVEVFTHNIEQSIKKSLALETHVLLSVAQVDDDTISIPDSLHDPRFNKHESGLYGFISDSAGQAFWGSYSAHSLTLSAELLTANSLGVGKSHFLKSEQYYIYQHAVMWEVVNDDPQLIIFSVLEDRADTNQKIADFRKQIGRWLAVTALLLVLALVLILLWGTLPLRELARRLKLIEKGVATHIEGEYPVELRRLTKNLNQLITTERKQRERYHATLADLAHSLKTPLAVIQAELELDAKNNQTNTTLIQQASRIDDIIKHQLQRAVVSSPNTLSESVPVAASVEKIKGAFEKIYHDKGVQFSSEISSDAVFKGDQRDLMEVLGNVLDNAFKACNNAVMLKAYVESRYLYIEVHDDGKGVAPENRNAILKRGLRADVSGAGQGIGLDVVRDIVGSYQGKVEINDSPLGGAVFILSFKFMA
ncbi:ATP-binding protein [Dasania sp. GY-MA-18]|uniref:histidine kinase n=1 Tax=Dasania phycosphaerae TaxID=2950436 RepID=A0A9J6RHM9_9GAMM|nr:MULTISPECIES: ATP-binding protein [Dasania]MCR8921413.1 ATP-binding protein [Dasania sp. GY-MA-18]MCZ0863841.1 ATP-binding protein [Dasania phycosphaerae]MCZ0867569.1 ATP-binding protein [Dasania phycosphaerae]